MPKLPKITGEELVNALKRAGFEVARQRGSHVQMKKFTEGEKVTLPVPVAHGVRPSFLGSVVALSAAELRRQPGARGRGRAADFGLPDISLAYEDLLLRVAHRDACA